MDRSSRASAQSPPPVSFQHNPFSSFPFPPPPDWPPLPRLSRARAHEEWQSRMAVIQEVPSHSHRAADTSSRSSPVASRQCHQRALLRTSQETQEETDTADHLATLNGTYDDPPSTPPARRSTRKRKAPETLTFSPESGPKKRAATEKPPASKKPPAETTRPPGNLKTDPDEDEKKQECDSNCCICMTEPEPQEVAFINGCEHSFCFGCIEKWADRENTCPLCKARFTKIERRQKTKRGKSTVKVKEKSQRSEFTSSIALEGLFGELGRSGIAFESFFARLGSSRFVNTQVASIIVRGMERGSNGSPSDAASRPSTRAYARRPPPADAASRAREMEAMFGGGDDDESDSDDDLGFSSFVNSMRRGASLRRAAAGPSFTLSSLGYNFTAPPPPPARNFAVNSNDATAGRSIETPLEICDSDEDDEVVVVETRPGSARRF